VVYPAHTSIRRGGIMARTLKRRVVITVVGAIASAPFSYIVKRVLGAWGILDNISDALGRWLKLSVPPDAAGWSLALIACLGFYGLLLWRVWRPRDIHHPPIIPQAAPIASQEARFSPATPGPPYSPILFSGLVEARGVPSKGYTALRVVVCNKSDEYLSGLVACLIRAEPEIDGLEAPIHLPLMLATKTRLDKLRDRGEQLPPQPFNLNAGAKKQIEVAWLPSDGVLEAKITHEAGEATYLVLGTHTLYVEVSGAGQPIVAGVKIDVADDDKQSWKPSLIVEAVGEAHGNKAR